MTGAIKPSLIGDESNALAFKFAETVGFEYVESRLSVGIACDHAMGSSTGNGFVIAGDGDVIRNVEAEVVRRWR